MSNRGVLRRQLRDAWADTMREAYVDQVINSERALQAQLAARLFAAFEHAELNRRIFVEPKLLVDGGRRRLHPDLLVCNTRNVFGVIELKYQPNVKPRFLKDMQALETVAWDSDTIEIVNTRYRGPEKGRNTYGVAADALFVWAGVYREPWVPIPPDRTPEIMHRRLMVLHAVTRRDQPPEVFVGKRRLAES